jgi:hypothetical protein
VEADAVKADAVETGDEQAARTEPDVDIADAVGAACPPARQRVRLQRFGRHGRYAWRAYPRRQGVLQQVSAVLTNGHT